MVFIKQTTPTAGDLLRVHRKAGYYHFGVAVAPDRVVHFTAEKSDLSNDAKEFKIIETSLERFILGDELEIEQPYSSPFDRDYVVKRAKNYANSHCFRGKPYNFVSNNCEHFARYCYNGNAFCDQVRTGALVVAAAGATIVALAAKKIASNKRKKIEDKSK